MVFIRVKRVKGHPYAYLVRSEWDPETRKPRQRVLKYLGRVDRARLDDVPEEHRGDDTVRAFFARQELKSAPGRASLEPRLRDALLDALLAGVRERVEHETDRAIDLLGVEAFVTRVLEPAMREIGERWADGRITPVDEHLATNLASAALRGNARVPPPGAKARTVVVALPAGEQHRLACDALEVLLRERGFRVLNVAGGAPTDAIVKFARKELPHALLVSATMPEQAEAAGALARAVSDATHGRVRVLVGGQAIAALDDDARAALAPAEARTDAAEAVRGLEAPDDVAA